MMGGSYTFAMPTISIILAERYDSVADPREVLTTQQNCIFIT
jgi:hypothetical protein